MKFSTPFTLAATTLFMMGSTDAHLRGQRSLETTDDNGGDCTGVDEDPCPDRDKDPWACIEVPCCAGLEEQLNNWDQDGYYYYKCMDKDASKPIPKKELKCSGSDYVKCLTGYIRPYDGVWVLDDYAPWGPKDPKCINWPQTSEQLCNECAGGCIDGDCSTDGKNFCKPPGRRSLETTDDIGGDCTGKDNDPWASGSEVSCCDDLEEQLNNWDHDGRYYYKCMDKDAWKPIPKKDLKCSGSDYVKCLAGYIIPYDEGWVAPYEGVWVLEGSDPRGPKDPECINWPQTSEQLCNECAGGCMDPFPVGGDCSTDGKIFCLPPPRN